ncbi:MAG: MCE family protein [Deltaproteobacteria bacterium]|nr:MCE family protein [Deltaproteobacteria bacterium]
MTTRAQKVRLGIFMILALFLLLGTVGTLAGLKLWNRKDRYFVHFQESVSGLDNGSTVKMKGVPVGQVEKISIGADADSVIVTLSLAPNTPITAGTRATITSIGITGLKFVELTGGSTGEQPIQPNTPRSYIRSEVSTLQSLTGKATDLATKMEETLLNLTRLTDAPTRQKVGQALVSADRLASAWAKLAEENDERVKRVLVHVERTMAAVSKITTQNVDSVRSAIQATDTAARALSRAAQNFKPDVTLDEFTKAAKAVRKRVEDPAITKTLASLSDAATRISAVTADLGKIVRRRDRQIGTIIENLDRASANLKSFTRAIADRPSLLLRGETVKERTIP